jgi:hypothetical protein
MLLALKSTSEANEARAFSIVFRASLPSKCTEDALPVAFNASIIDSRAQSNKGALAL